MPYDFNSTIPTNPNLSSQQEPSMPTTRGKISALLIAYNQLRYQKPLIAHKNHGQNISSHHETATQEFFPSPRNKQLLSKTFGQTTLPYCAVATHSAIR